MRRICFLLVVCLLIPFSVFSDDLVTNLIPSGLPSSTSSTTTTISGASLSSIPGLQGIVEEKILVNPYAMIGYQKTGVNMTVPMNVDYDPFPAITGAHLKLGSIDVTLEDFNFWYGTAGANIILSPKLTLFGSVSGYLPKTFLEYGHQPVSFGAATANPEFTMTGYGLELWNIQCGASVEFVQGYSVILGSLWQHTSMKYEDMRIGSTPVNPSLRQDFMLKNWAPFVGLQYLQPRAYRASVIYSPYLTSSGNLKSTTTTPVATTLTYSLNQPGYLVGVTGEYFLPTPELLSLSVWFTGAASVIRGDSEAQFDAPGISISSNTSGLTVSQYSIGGGFTFGVVF
jgi:hypothetical protein